MPDPVVDYETAAGGFARVLEQCDDLTVPSPCEGWTAQDVVDHVVGGTSYYTAAWGGTVIRRGHQVRAARGGRGNTKAPRPQRARRKARRLKPPMNADERR